MHLLRPGWAPRKPLPASAECVGELPRRELNMQPKDKNMQPKNTWADTIPPEEINARRHPLPHPARRTADSHVIYSTFPKAADLRAPLNEADQPGPHTSERIRAAFLLACAFTFGYAIGTALVQWGGA